MHSFLLEDNKNYNKETLQLRDLLNRSSLSKQEDVSEAFRLIEEGADPTVCGTYNSQREYPPHCHQNILHYLISNEGDLKKIEDLLRRFPSLQQHKTENENEDFADHRFTPLQLAMYWFLSHSSWQPKQKWFISIIIVLAKNIEPKNLEVHTTGVNGYSYYDTILHLLLRFNSELKNCSQYEEAIRLLLEKHPNLLETTNTRLHTPIDLLLEQDKTYQNFDPNLFVIFQKALPPFCTDRRLYNRLKEKSEANPSSADIQKAMKAMEELNKVRSSSFSSEPWDEPVKLIRKQPEPKGNTSTNSSDKKETAQASLYGSYKLSHSNNRLFITTFWINAKNAGDPFLKNTGTLEARAMVIKSQEPQTLHDIQILLMNYVLRIEKGEEDIKKPINFKSGFRGLFKGWRATNRQGNYELAKTLIANIANNPLIKKDDATLFKETKSVFSPEKISTLKNQYPHMHFFTGIRSNELNSIIEKARTLIQAKITELNPPPENKV